jgi:hypothetical protein
MVRMGGSFLVSGDLPYFRRIMLSLGDDFFPASRLKAGGDDQVRDRPSRFFALEHDVRVDSASLELLHDLQTAPRRTR